MADTTNNTVEEKLKVSVNSLVGIARTLQTILEKVQKSAIEDAVIDASGAALTGLQDSIDELASSVSTVSDNVDALLEGAGDIVSGLATVAGAVNTIDGKVDDVLDDTSEIKSGLSTVSSNVDTIKSDVSSTKTEVFTFGSKFTALSNDTSTLKNDASILKADTSTLKSNDTTILAGISSLATDTSVIKKGITDTRSDIASVASSASSASTEIGSHESTETTLNTVHKKLTEVLKREGEFTDDGQTSMQSKLDTVTAGIGDVAELISIINGEQAMSDEDLIEYYEEHWDEIKPQDII